MEKRNFTKTIGKRGTALLLTLFLLLLSLPETVFASSYETFTLSAVPMQIELPSDYLVYLKEGPSSEEEFEEAGGDYDKIEDYCRDYDVSLLAISLDEEGFLTISVNAADASRDYFNFSLYGDAELDQMKDDFVDIWEEDGNTTVTYAEVIREAQATFIWMNYRSWSEDGYSYYIKCFTVYNGYAVDILMLSFDSPASSVLSEELEDIIGSAYFAETLDPPAGTYAAATVAGTQGETTSAPELTLPKTGTNISDTEQLPGKTKKILPGEKGTSEGSVSEPGTASTEFNMGDYQTYLLSDLSMRVEIPIDYIVYSRERSSPESAFEELGLDFEGKEKYCIENDIYLDAYSTGQSYQILISMYDDSFSQKYFDLNLCGDEDLEQIKKGWITDLEQYNLKVDNVLVEQGTQAKYVVLTYSTPTYRCNHYFTIYNGHTFELEFFSFNDPDFLEFEQLFKPVIDSISFTVTLNPPAGSYAAALATAKNPSEAASSKAAPTLEVEAMESGEETAGKETDKNAGKTASAGETVLYILLFTAGGAALFGLTYWMIEKRKKKKSAEQRETKGIDRTADAAEAETGPNAEPEEGFSEQREPADAAGAEKETINWMTTKYMEDQSVETDSGNLTGRPDVLKWTDAENSGVQSESAEAEKAEANIQEETAEAGTEGINAFGWIGAGNGGAQTERTAEDAGQLEKKAAGQKEPEGTEETKEKSVPAIAFCRKCGAKLLSGDIYCWACGEKVEKPEKAER